jgi:hypothetical protein
LVAGSEEYRLTGQANSNAKHGNTIIYGRLWGTVPELLFEKKSTDTKVEAVTCLLFEDNKVADF